MILFVFFFFQAEDGIRDLVRSRGLGDVYKRQELTSTKSKNAVVKYYKPSELLGMFTSFLSQQDVNRQVIYLQGIYLKNPKHDPRWTSRYDLSLIHI